ncbi:MULTISPECIES: MFS transporter [unclassified Streptomyces]|uniref:MFS transporter n=1 Tax=unclassified Streptomyces TaxID=2593676 RepID=UPI0006FE34EF|nr:MULTISPECIES: MFS transporter [unclassified Streptomyces]KQX49981.1 MFS transporter [Streptomyces sp. Root1304]KRA79976.1 MFS transporter [Streptomyces sp. Root66D1]
MWRGVSLGRDYGWLWAAYAGSTMGTWVAFNAFPLLAITVLHEGTAAVAALAAVGAAVGAAVAVPLGPWVEFRRKRPVMIGMDLVRCAAMLSVAVAYAFGRLGFAQLMVVSVLVAAADITFGAASGAFLKSLVRPEGLLVAQARFESTTWTATVIGPPLGGALFAVLGPVATVVADALSYLLSAAGIRAIGKREERPPGGTRARLSAGDLLEGWRHILAHPVLRPLFLNTVVVNGLIMATAPLLAVLMLGPLGFSPWQYGLAFAIPCAAGLIGSRLARPLVLRFGQRRVLLVSGTLRACWPIGLVLIHPGVTGLLLVIGVEFALIGCAAVFTPVLSAHRLEVTDTGRVARTLTAWSVSTKTSIAAMTALGGALATVTGPRAALGVAGILLLATPLLLPWAAGAPRAGIDTCKSSVAG